MSGGVKQGWEWENELYASISRKRYEVRPKLLTTNRKLNNALSIDTKVDDLR